MAVGLPTGAIKFVIEGTQDNVQSWSTGFWVALDGGDSVSATTLPSILSLVEAAVGSAVVTLKGAIWSAQTKYTGTAAYYYAANTAEAGIVARNTASAAQGSLTTYAPTFQAICVSLRSVFAGKSQRGRMYIPWSAGGIAANGQWLSADIAGVVNEMADLFIAVNAMNWTSYGAASQAVVAASFTKHETTPISHLQADSIPDLQRRRKDKLGPAFLASAVVT